MLTQPKATPNKKGKLKKAFREVYSNTPKTLKYSPSSEKGRKQLIAIAFSKARRDK